MKKGTCFLLIYAILMTILVVAPFTANANEKDIAVTGEITASGTTGDCTWKIEDGVLHISGNGEMGSYGLTAAPWSRDRFYEVIIEDGVTTIGDGSFSSSGLTKVTIGNTVTSIGNCAFEECFSLYNIDMPDSVTSIGEGAFVSCWSLTSIDIPDSVTSIGDSAFRNCTSLTSVDIGDSVTSIGVSAFSRCTSLTSIDFPDSVTIIGDFAFDNCTSLSSIDIPDSVLRIGNYAFRNCTSLSNVSIGDSVTSIGSSAFSGCTNLKDVNIHITDMDSYCNHPVVPIIPDYSKYNYHIIYLDKILTDLEIPSTVNDIGEKSFFNCNDLISVTIPDSVKSIGTYAFSNCKGLEDVSIGDSVESIGNYAFDGCTSLSNLTVGGSVTSVGSSAFSGCTNLKDVNIHITDIDSYCNHPVIPIIPDYSKYDYHIIYLDKILTDLEIPSTVNDIGERAFFNCNDLKSVNIPDSVNSIGKYAFSNCKGLEYVSIGNSVSSISDSVFYGCTGLTNLTIGSTVEAIASKAFYDCLNLKTITIPASVTDIFDKAFGYYTKEGMGESKVKNFTIYGYKGTEAQRYANDNNFIFVALDEEPTEPAQKPLLGDVDGDEEVGVLDATYIQRYSAGFNTPYPIGEPIE